MNDTAIIFQRSSIGTAQEREAEAARLERYAASRDLKVTALYTASGEPDMLTIDMLINHCMAR